MQATDFAEWLAAEAQPGDAVVLRLALGGDRDFSLLGRLLERGALAAVTAVHVHWRFSLDVRSFRTCVESVVVDVANGMSQAMNVIV